MQGSSRNLRLFAGLACFALILIAGSTLALAQFRTPEVRINVHIPTVHTPTVSGTTNLHVNTGNYGRHNTVRTDRTSHNNSTNYNTVEGDRVPGRGRHRIIDRPNGREITSTPCGRGGNLNRIGNCNIGLSVPGPTGPVNSGSPGNPVNNGGIGGRTVGGNTGGNNNNRRVTLPPTGERRYVPDEIITEFATNTSPQSIDQFARRYNLTRLESQNLPLIGTTIYRWRILGRRSVPSMIGRVGTDGIVASVQPNFIFTVQQQSTGTTVGTEADEAQYALASLNIEQAHQIATGKSIVIAIIDSKIDISHPDLTGAVLQGYDALSPAGDAQLHGTEMAGAIAAHGKLTGVAPGAELLAVRAFDDTPGESKGTSGAIYKSLQWAVDNHARIINMSFVGPQDPTLHRLVEAAYRKDIVLIAAAGNAGPKSPPLYPAADPDVIAVTAINSQNGLFRMANRGSYIAVAAPGVEILALAPGGAYETTTGTSVAAAHVSGVVALLLQRNPSLKPAEIRTILMSTAHPLGEKGPNPEFGAGLVDAYRAVSAVTVKTTVGAGEAAVR